MVLNLDSIHINPNLDQANFCVHTQFFVTLAIVFFAYQDVVPIPYQDLARHNFVFNSLFLETLT